MIDVSNAIDKHVAEGTAEHHLTNSARYRSLQLQRTQMVRMIVLDVITDPALLTDAFYAHVEHELGVRQAQVLRSAPRDTLIAVPAAGAASPASAQPTLLFPLLSHARLPVRPGEHVLAVFEDPEDIGSVGFWLSRMPSVRHVDDPNIMHHPREHDPTFVQDVRDPDAQPKYEFHNGVRSADGTIMGETMTLQGGDDAYESVITGSMAGSLRVIDVVPRFKRRVDDLTIEGARGGLIVVGSERTGAAYDTSNDKVKRLDDDVPAAAAIDVSVGRGRTDATAVKQIKNSLGFNEAAKDAANVVTTEGDPDFVNDAARCYLSQRCKPDEPLGLGDPPIELSSDAASCVIAKGDSVRIVARRDMRITVIGSKQLNSGDLTDDRKDSSTTELVIDAGSGDSELSCGHDHTIHVANELDADGKIANIKFDDQVNIDAKRITIGGDKHPAPAFDTFCSSLADLIDNLSGALSAGTTGTAAKQQLVNATTFAIAAQQFATELRKVSSKQGSFASSKVTNG